MAVLHGVTDPLDIFRWYMDLDERIVAGKNWQLWWFTPSAILHLPRNPLTLLVIKCLCTTLELVFTQHVLQCSNNTYNDLTQWNMHSNTVQVVVVQLPLCTLYSYVLQPTTVNSTFTTHVLQCHIYFVISPLLIPHPPGRYGLRNGSLALFKEIP